MTWWVLAKADLAGQAALLTALTTFLGFLAAQILSWRRTRQAKARLAEKGIQESSAVTGLVTLSERQEKALESMQAQMQHQINDLSVRLQKCEDTKTGLVQQIQEAAENLRNWYPPRS